MVDGNFETRSSSIEASAAFIEILKACIYNLQTRLSNKNGAMVMIEGILVMSRLPMSKQSISKMNVTSRVNFGQRV